MGKRLRPKYVIHRCVVCSKISHRFFAVLDPAPPEAPKVCLCSRHAAESEKLGWFLFCEKYDFAALYLYSLGYEFTPSGFVRYRPEVERS